MARNDVFLNINALSPADAVVTGQQDMTAATVPELVLGDTPTFNFYFTDNTNVWPSWAGNAAYTVTWALSDAVSGDFSPAATTGNATPITGGWSVILPLNSYDLVGLLNTKRVGQPYPVQNLWQQLRVTDPSGNEVTRAMFWTPVRYRAISDTQNTESASPTGGRFVTVNNVNTLTTPTAAQFYAANPVPTSALGTAANGELLIGNGTGFTKATLTAGSGVSITNGSGSITITATDGDITLDDGTAAAPSLKFTADTDTGIFRPSDNVVGISAGGVSRATFGATSAINGTTIPGSKTLVVTTDKLSALAATTSAELAGVISDKTGTGALVFANTPTLVTPNIGAATGTSVNLSGAGTFGGNLTVSGTGGVQLNSVANLTWGGSYGAGIPTIAIPSVTSIGFYPTGSTSGKTFELFGTGNATLAGNLTVSGTGTSSFGGDLTFATNKGIYSAVQNGRLYLSGDSAGAGAFLTLTGSSFSNPNNIRIDANTGTISNLANTKNSTWDINQNWAIAGDLTVSGTASSFGGFINAGGAVYVRKDSGEVFRADAAGAGYRIVADQNGVLLGGATTTVSGNLTVSGTASSFGGFANAGGAVYVRKDSGEVFRADAAGAGTRIVADQNGVLLGGATTTVGGNLTVSGGTITSGTGTLTLNSSANTVVLQSAGTTALTLDSSQNATFAGKIGIGVSPSSWNLNLQQSAVNSAVRIISPTALGLNDSSIYIAWASGSKALIAASYESTGSYRPLVLSAGGVDSLTLDTTGNATFAGSIAIGNTVNTVSPTSPNRTITMVIGGTTYYIHAKTTND